MLVTGITGRIGLSMLQELRATGHTLRALTRSRPIDRIACLLDEQVQGDIQDETSWQRALSDVDVVVHLAGISHNVAGVLTANILSTHTMALACLAQGVRRIVFASSNCVLGHCDRASTQPFALDYLPIDEAHPLRPEADYGLSKSLAEQVLQAASRSGNLQVCALRFAWIWSDAMCTKRRTQSYDESAFASTLWAYVHAEDAACALRQALESPPAQDFCAMYISAADTTADSPSLALVERYYGAAAAQAANLPGHASLFAHHAAKQLIGYHPERSWRR
ncbi:MAG: NAD-dependent epimerase/dehydratase family protein [Polyangiales bacterium]